MLGKWVMAQFCVLCGILFCMFWNFMLLFGNFSPTIWVFWAFYAVLLRTRFVVIYALFLVKYFWLKPCLWTKIVFLNVWCPATLQVIFALHSIVAPPWGQHIKNDILQFCDFCTSFQGKPIYVPYDNLLMQNQDNHRIPV